MNWNREEQLAREPDEKEISKKAEMAAKAKVRAKKKAQADIDYKKNKAARAQAVRTKRVNREDRESLANAPHDEE